jgi:hypothetical protein
VLLRAHSTRSGEWARTRLAKTLRFFTRAGSLNLPGGSRGLEGRIDRAQGPRLVNRRGPQAGVPSQIGLHKRRITAHCRRFIPASNLQVTGRAPSMAIAVPNIAPTERSLVGSVRGNHDRKRPVYKEIGG